MLHKMETNQVFLVLIFALIQACCPAEVTQNDAAFQLSRKEVTNYLRKYGYLSNTDYPASSLTLKQLSAAIKTFQQFSNLDATGVANEATLQWMRMPRCGQEDLVRQSNGRWGISSKGIVSTNTRWNKQTLTWRYDKQAQTWDMHRDEVRRILKKAFAIWSRVTKLKFEETEDSNPDIWIRFQSLDHHNAQKFDGEGGTFAYAFYPHGSDEALKGDIYFDDDEFFSNTWYRGKNLLWIATHEIGHSIGLAHSKEQKSMMYPWYFAHSNFDFNVSEGDVQAAKKLYPDQKGELVSTENVMKILMKINNGGCQDKVWRLCQVWSKYGYCDSTAYRPYMEENCCATCVKSKYTTKYRNTTPAVQKIETTATPTTKRTTTTTNTTTKTTTTITTTTKRPTTTTTKIPRAYIRKRRPMKTCPTSSISALWEIPKYSRYSGILTSTNRLYTVSDKGRLTHTDVPFGKYLRYSGLSAPISAALSVTLGKDKKKYQIFFSGRKYALYTSMVRLHSGPHSFDDASGPLKVRFPRKIKEINAAMSWNRMPSKLYFFFRKAGQGYYYRYDSIRQSFDPGYPKRVSQGFKNMPKVGPDAALSLGRLKKTYFLIHDKLYEMDNRGRISKRGYSTKFPNPLIRRCRAGRKDGIPEAKAVKIKTKKPSLFLRRITGYLEKLRERLASKSSRKKFVNSSNSYGVKERPRSDRLNFNDISGYLTKYLYS